MSSSLQKVENEPQCPGSPKTPKILWASDSLRAELADAIDAQSRMEENGTAISRADIIQGFTELLSRYPDEEVWSAALRSPYNDAHRSQDIPIVEAAARDQHRFIDALISTLPLSPWQQQELISSPGRYGRTALSHAVRMSNWRAADHLIRHGASIGHVDDNTGIINGILRAARRGRAQAGSWRKIDKNLATLFATCTSLYGKDWAIAPNAPTTALNDDWVTSTKRRREGATRISGSARISFGSVDSIWSIGSKSNSTRHVGSPKESCPARQYGSVDSLLARRSVDLFGIKESTPRSITESTTLTSIARPLTRATSGSKHLQRRGSGEKACERSRHGSSSALVKTQKVSHSSSTVSDSTRRSDRKSSDLEGRVVNPY